MDFSILKNAQFSPFHSVSSPFMEIHETGQNTTIPSFIFAYISLNLVYSCVGNEPRTSLLDFGDCLRDKCAVFFTVHLLPLKTTVVTLYATYLCSLEKEPNTTQ